MFPGLHGFAALGKGGFHVGTEAAQRLGKFACHAVGGVALGGPTQGAGGPPRKPGTKSDADGEPKDAAEQLSRPGCAGGLARPS